MNGSQHGVCLILHKPVTQSARQAPGIWPGRRGFDSTLLAWLRHVRSLWPGKEVPAVLQLLNCCSRIGFGIRLVVCRSVWSVGRLFNLSAYKTVAHAVGKCEMWASSCSSWGPRTLHGQLWLCPRFNALMLPEFYSQSRAGQSKANEMQSACRGRF